jgi:hypothetical protein
MVQIQINYSDYFMFYLAQILPDDATRTADVQAPAFAQGKPTFDDAAVPDLPAVAVAVTAQDQSTISVVALPAVAATAKTAISAFSIHNNEDDDCDLAPLGPRTLGNAAATADTAEDGHHVDHCVLQVFDLLSSGSESEDEFDASEFDDCDGF